MTIRSRIRNWLGITEILENQDTILKAVITLSQEHNFKHQHQYEILTNLRLQNRITQRALGRLVAKVDPDYTRDEIDPDRRAASDRLGGKVIDKLLAEHKMSNPGDA